MTNKVDTFAIPEEIAKELSDLLTRQSIREKLIVSLIDDIEKYRQAEDMLVPIVSKIEVLKMKITNDFVPNEYRSDEYVWNYDGWEISGCNVDILT